MSFDSLSIDTCWVLRPEYSQSATGAVTAKYQPIGKYTCRKWGVSNNKQVTGGGQGEVTTHVIDLPAGADIKAKDRLRFEADDYDVLGVNPVKGSGGLHHIEVRAMLVIR